MGSTVSRKLKLQVEPGISLKGLKKETQTSYLSQRKNTLPFWIPFPAGKPRTSFSRIGPVEFAFCSPGMKTLKRSAAAVFVCF